MNRHGRQAGMTLLEILVALTIFVLMAGAGYSGLQQALAIQSGLDQSRQFWRRLDTVMLLIQQDFDQARNISPRIPVGATFPFAGGSNPDMSAEGAILLFTRGGHTSFSSGPVSPYQRIAYRLRSGTLYRASWPRLNMPDDGPVPEAVLLDGVAEVRLQYLDPAYRWQASWPLASGRDTPATLPRAIRLGLVLENGHSYERIFHVGARG